MTIFDFEMTHEQQEYIRYLFGLYQLEMEDGYDLGRWPSFEEFLHIAEEELRFYS